MSTAPDAVVELIPAEDPPYPPFAKIVVSFKNQESPPGLPALMLPVPPAPTNKEYVWPGVTVIVVIFE